MSLRLETSATQLRARPGRRQGAHGRCVVTGDLSAERGDSARETRALVAAARAGDRSAFGRLHDRFAPMVHGILLAAVRPGEADDLTQDVFLSALQRLCSLEDDGRFGAWLASIARNRARDHYRRGRRSSPLPEGLAADAPPRAEAAEALAAIRDLPAAYQEPLILRLVEGMSGPEIAERTGLTPASVRVNLHRGMKQLRARLGLEKTP